MFGSALVALTTLTVAVSAATNFTTCCTVDPTTVTSTDRNNWCRGQTNTCPLLCQNGQTANNTCDATTLTYNCTCLTGSGPGNLSNYDQTLPSYECAAWRDQCTAAHPNDANGQAFCQSFACGKQNASLVYLAASSSSASAGASTTGTTATSGTAAGATNSAASISASRSAAAAAATAAVAFGKQYGTAAMGVAGMAIFGLAL